MRKAFTINYMIFFGGNHKGKSLDAGKWPHAFAGILFLLFGLSHFAMSSVHTEAQESINSVFPFFTVKEVFLLAGIYELSLAAFCFWKMGRDVVNLAILIFIAVMVWYHWALYYTGGGPSCGCLGILGRALHLSKAEEKAAPIVVLCLLFLSITPWILRKITGFISSYREKLRSAILIFAVLSCYDLQGQDTIEIHGEYDCDHYNPQKALLYTNLSVHAVFTCILSGNSWSIFATNVDNDPESVGLRTGWERIVYDGTNTYTFMPYHVEAQNKTWTTEIHQGKGCVERVTISPGPIFLKDYDEWLQFDVIWLAYGLVPKSISTNTEGIVEFPLPWHNARDNPMSYGSEWQITSSEDGRFVSQCRVVSNAKLTLPNDQELRRPTLSPPLSLPLRNRFNILLSLRKGDKPDGFVEATYEVKSWYKTNNYSIPVVAEELRYLNGLFTNYPTVKAHVKAAEISLKGGSEDLLPPVKVKTFVTDYRYRRVDTNTICSKVDYVLSPGSSWKSETDPKLVRQVNDFMKYGPELNSVSGQSRSIFTWLLLAIIIAPLAIMLKSKTNKQKGD
jgi:hypothetical protein